MIKFDWQAILSSIFSRTGLTIIGLSIVLIGSALYLTQCGENLYFWHGVKKDKAGIANQMQQANVIRSEIANLQNANAQVQANINADTRDYANQTYGREDLKVETNQALANYQKAVNTNSNVDKAAEDLNRVLEKLDQ